MVVAIDHDGYDATSVSVRTLRDPTALRITLNQQSIFDADVRYPDPRVVDLGGGNAYQPAPCLCGAVTAIEKPRGVRRILRRLRRR
ncbi:hypothetical protein BBK14_23555 [Parafrankia soli]|uniref:Uncharacterized protein n=1 Tax=Parafrankia soli TaxID=2599596 RepID=A0A1S1PQH7_9ACTN|nr:hypothetical protein BBK14_23555 [Parafrankia soli]